MGNETLRARVENALAVPNTPVETIDALYSEINGKEYKPSASRDVTNIRIRNLTTWLKSQDFVDTGKDFAGVWLAFDFDGTITDSNEYPAIGNLRQGIVSCINKLYNRGAHIIIWTCRNTGSEDQGIAFADMLDFLNQNGIQRHNVNENSNQPFFSRKIWAHLYIGDDALGWNPDWTGDDIYEMICNHFKKPFIQKIV